MNIYDFLLLEKRIKQISTSIDIIFSFDTIKTKHAEYRQDFNKRGLSDDKLNYISNREMSEFVSQFRTDIAEMIVVNTIDDGTEFVLRSLNWQLSMVVIAVKVSFNHWKLIIKTVFRESEEVRLRTWKNQIILEK